MAIKNVIQVNRYPVNKYSLVVQPGVGQILLVSISGLEEELDAPELPDRTVRSGGRSKPIEFDGVQPMHHTQEVLVMETWWGLCKLSLLGYLKLASLIHFDESGLIPTRKFTLPNIWVSKRAHTDQELENDGDMNTITWTFKADQILPA
jgi:hypothetical protein